MGGCATLMALTGETPFSAGVLTSPMLGLPIEKQLLGVVPTAARLGVSLGLASVYAPLRTADPRWEQFKDNQLTHDETRFRRYSRMLAACPDLALGKPTWGWLNSALSGTAAARRVEKITIPLVILSAAEDTVVDNEAQRAVAERLGASLVEVLGAWHEILIEKDSCRAIFWREFDALAARI